ncbi:MAG: lytic transglycosylase domain-containing protein [Deltaproteobacteria bacterium]|nr:lytic transglycosylase domain-containing protein [Deltaproteobacteria bacterium]
MAHAYKRCLFVILLAIAMAACAGSEADLSSEQVVSRPKRKKGRPSKPRVISANQLAALDAAIDEHDHTANYVKDIRVIVKATELEKAGNFDGASKAWFEALTLSHGSFGKLSLQGWIRTYAESAGKSTDIDVFSKLLMTETQNGKLSPYMTESGLSRDEQLRPIIRQVASKWISSGHHANDAQSPDFLPPTGIPATDPLLTKLVVKYCRKSTLDDPSWSTWQHSLSASWQDYWSALVNYQCGNNSTATISILKELYPRLAEQPETQGMAVEIAGRMISLQRSVGQRVDAAETYLDLVKLWGNPGVTGKAMGTDPVSLVLRRIDETLWAARYRALVGDLENAKTFARDALVLAKRTAKSQSLSLRKAQNEQLSILTVDAYHTLASRVAVEKKHYHSASSLNTLALKTPELNDQWRDRLAWAGGIYEYLSGNYVAALNHWKKVQESTADESQRIASMFWRSRCHEKLGQIDEAGLELANMIGRAPLSYYSVIASGESGILPPTEWKKAIGHMPQLTDRISETQDFGLSELRLQPKLGQLFMRAELLLAADIQSLGRVAVAELETEMNSRLSPKKHLSAFVYLSRLQFKAGAHLAAIGLTGKLAKLDQDFWQAWPEQILIYFPQPYLSLYQEQALALQVPTSLLLAISRQESGFTPDIRSSANAIGIMQLIPSTAKKYAAEIGLTPNQGIEEQLLDPTINIRLGSHYLRLLTATYDGFPPAVYGSYNAGEFAMDAWLKRRHHPDPLMFVELVPFGETREYIKNVWRNAVVYDYLISQGIGPVDPGFDFGFAG